MNASLRLVNDVVLKIEHESAEALRRVVNDIHKIVSDDVLKKLNFNTKNLDKLNEIFNQGVNVLKKEEKKMA